MKRLLCMLEKWRNIKGEKEISKERNET